MKKNKLKVRILPLVLVPVLSFSFFTSCTKKEKTSQRSTFASSDEETIGGFIDMLGDLQSSYDTKVVVMTMKKDESGQIVTSYKLEKTTGEKGSYKSIKTRSLQQIRQGEEITCSPGIRCAKEGKECMDSGGTLTGKKTEDGKYHLVCE